MYQFLPSMRTITFVCELAHRGFLTYNDERTSLGLPRITTKNIPRKYLESIDSSGVDRKIYVQLSFALQLEVRRSSELRWSPPQWLHYNTCTWQTNWICSIWSFAIWNNSQHERIRRIFFRTSILTQEQWVWNITCDWTRRFFIPSSRTRNLQKCQRGWNFIQNDLKLTCLSIP